MSVLEASSVSAGFSFMQIMVSLGSIYICWWALQCLRFERFVREPGSRQAKLLHLILAVIIGRQFSAFLLEYASWSLL